MTSILLNENLFKVSKDLNKSQETKMNSYKEKLNKLTPENCRNQFRYKTRFHYYYIMIKTAGKFNRFTGKIGHRQTTLMYHTRGSVAQLATFMVPLIGYNLLDYNDEDRTFRPTPKGYEFLKRYEALAELVPDLLKGLDQFEEDDLQS